MHIYVAHIKNLTLSPTRSWFCVCLVEVKSMDTHKPAERELMFRVRVNKIESIRDVDGNMGKRIELVEEREISNYVMRPQTDEAKMVQDMLSALQQQMPMLAQRQQIAVPKIVLFLTESEYDSLGIIFDVNQVYDVSLGGQGIKFTKI